MIRQGNRHTGLSHLDNVLMKLYVGNLPNSMSDTELADLFRPFGSVSAATITTTSLAGRLPGFGFVEMLRESGEIAVSELNGRQIDCRVLRVAEAEG